LRSDLALKLDDAPDRSARHILVVDDQELIRQLLAEVLTKEGYDVTLASNGEEAIKLLRSDTFDLVISDSDLPGVGGLEVVEEAKRIDPECPVIVISGYRDTEAQVGAIGQPRLQFILKPFRLHVVRRTVASLLALARPK